MDLFQPDPMLLKLLFLKKFIYLPVVAVLSLLRLFIARDISRRLAMLSLLISLFGLAVLFGPSLLELGGGLMTSAAHRIANAMEGMALLYIASAPLFASAILPGVRGRFIDFLHICLFGALLTLWYVTL